MEKRKYTTSARSTEKEENLNPFLLLHLIGGKPSINFKWKNIGAKRRLIGIPNIPMRDLHELFIQYIELSVMDIVGETGWRLHELPSSTAFVQGSNSLLNAKKHEDGNFFYITDIRGAYQSISLEKLATLIVYIKRYEIYQDELSLDGLAVNLPFVSHIMRDPLFTNVHAFLETFCSGIHGIGLAVGAPASPSLVNLYCEAFIDGRLRDFCQKRDITYSRYADDFVFCRDKPITSDIRKNLRSIIQNGEVEINHRKSFVLARSMGTVFITKTGLSRGTEKAKLVFPQKKRRKLHGIIKSYLKMKMDWPEKVSGYIAEFLYYFKNVDVHTASDLKTFALCKEFESESEKYKNKHRKH